LTRDAIFFCKLAHDPHFLLQFALCLLVAQEKGTKQARSGARSGPSSRNRQRKIYLDRNKAMDAGWLPFVGFIQMSSTPRKEEAEQHVLPDMPFPACYK